MNYAVLTRVTFYALLTRDIQFKNVKTVWTHDMNYAVLTKNELLGVRHVKLYRKIYAVLICGHDVFYALLTRDMIYALIYAVLRRVIISI
jgi:hypothetical protein